MIVSGLTTEMVRLLGLFPTVVLTTTIALLAAHCMFVFIGMTGPPQD